MLSKQFLNKFWAIPEWHEYSACRGLDINIFFPEYSVDKAFAQARSVCQSCPVIAECLDNQLRYEDFDDRWGMFGGLTPNERKEIRYKKMRRM
jgi:WhiB family transcriptional regulator, redox-sensing transcriptional regulator